jgi:hypothetical protein
MKNRILFQSSVRSAIQLLVDDFRARNEILTVVQVGACKGNIGNDPLHDIIKNQGHASAHLIEAVSWLYDDLAHAMMPYADHIKCYNFAIGAKDEIRNFYSVSEKYGEEYPDAEPWKKYQIGSLTDKHLRYWVPEEYIEVDEVQCISPGTFLNTAAVNPRDLNLLITDTEGFDGEIVTEFLTITHPEMIIYEHKVMSADENDLMYRLLEKYSYKYKKIGEDVIAILSMG